MNIQPLKDNVVISPEKKIEKNKTETGIYLPESSTGENDRPQIGKVVAVGDSKKITVKKGQRVIYSRYTGTEVIMNDVTYLIVKNDDVLAVIKK
ncbi:MAG: co-chaperone GroES [Parcubacteria group bacterium]|jgi:chaperonin GroES